MMFRLPVCPHCGTVYRYRDTKNAQKQKVNTCYHCKKKFRAKLLPYVAVEALVLTVICIGFNLLLLSRMEELNLFVLFASTAVFLLLIYLLFPFFMKFIKIEEKSGKNVPQTAKNGKNTEKASKNAHPLNKNIKSQSKNQKKNRKKRNR